MLPGGHGILELSPEGRQALEMYTNVIATIGSAARLIPVRVSYSSEQAQSIAGGRQPLVKLTHGLHSSLSIGPELERR